MGIIKLNKKQKTKKKLKQNNTMLKQLSNIKSIN